MNAKDARKDFDLMETVTEDDLSELIMASGLENATKNIYVVESSYRRGKTLCFDLESVRNYTIADLIEALDDKDTVLVKVPNFEEWTDFKKECVGTSKG